MPSPANWLNSGSPSIPDQAAPTFSRDVILPGLAWSVRLHRFLRPAARGGVAVAGLPATQVARRAGHGVAVLLKIYALPGR